MRLTTTPVISYGATVAAACPTAAAAAATAATAFQREAVKALIPSKRLTNIEVVPRDPKCTAIESAEFWFWAKKMTCLGLNERNGRGQARGRAREVLLGAGHGTLSSPLRGARRDVGSGVSGPFMVSCPRCKNGAEKGSIAAVSSC